MAASVSLEPRGRHYLAVFLFSLTVLMLEIAYARRVAAMVRAAREAEGVERAGAHVAVLSLGNTATVLAKRTPFTPDELDRPLLATAFFIGPLLVFRRRRSEVSIAVAVPLLAYFGCLGYGFMMLEVPLLQHFILLLGYPVYALAVVLFALLLFSGLGSLVSARFAPIAPAALIVLLVTIISIAGAYFDRAPVLVERPVMATRMAAGSGS